MIILWIIMILLCVVLIICGFLIYRIGQCFDRMELDFNNDEEDGL